MKVGITEMKIIVATNNTWACNCVIMYIKVCNKEFKVFTAVNA